MKYVVVKFSYEKNIHAMDGNNREGNNIINFSLFPLGMFEKLLQPYNTF